MKPVPLRGGTVERTLREGWVPEQPVCQHTAGNGPESGRKETDTQQN